MSETLSPRVAEILEESRRALLAHAEAARLGIEGGETLSGGLALEAARARLTEQGIDPDACMEEELAAALAAVGEFEDDLAIVPEDAPPEPEPAVGTDLDRAARRLLAERGETLTERSYLIALDVVGRRSR
jgi:hypothetical protein